MEDAHSLVVDVERRSIGEAAEREHERTGVNTHTCGNRHQILKSGMSGMWCGALSAAAELMHIFPVAF